MSVVIIGRNSFIAQNLAKTTAASNWQFITHNEALSDKAWSKDAQIVLNTAFASELYKAPYNENLDIDQKIAALIQPNTTHYIMLSSRAVYGPHAESLSETTPLKPQTSYAKNKQQIEQTLQSTLPQNRLTILRCANVFGFEWGRSSFTGRALQTLKEQEKIIYDMSPRTTKDFIPVSVLCDILSQMLIKPVAGIYNIGSGIDFETGQVAEALISGYGKGELIVTNNEIKDQFSMDISKIKGTLSVPEMKHDTIENEFKCLGQKLKNI